MCARVNRARILRHAAKCKHVAECMELTNVMPSIRKTAVMVAVICFFVMAVIGSVKGLSPPTCCYRAVIGALIGYVVTSLTGRVVLAIIIDAMVSSKFAAKRNREQERGGAD